MQEATEIQVLPQDTPGGRSAGGWQIFWLLLHVAGVYAVVKFVTPSLAGWTHGILLLLDPSTPGSFQFFFSHILAFSFFPAFLFGLINSRWKQRVGEFVWLFPAVILAYKFVTFPFPASSVLVLQQSKLPAVFHQYFGGGFVISEFQDWHEFWSIVGSNPDMTRGMTQLQYTAPFYAGIAYSIAAWIGRRTSLTQTVVEKVKRWEQTRFKHQQ
jgi:hypothetical protein